MMQRPIEEWWGDLDPATRQSFAENPGCLVLPRTISNAVCQVSGDHAGQDRHGRLELSALDREFVRRRDGKRNQ